MAPGRKRGAKGAKTKSELSLGDLVLAKVKGFPAWPAKISRPEDWERTPDPKKYFVQFFGTAEIAFVAPADIQAFTTEAKNKLSARCQGKTVKYFAQAVKEICKEFEELQQNSSSLRDDTEKPALGYEAPAVDGLVDDAAEVDSKDGLGIGGPNGETESKSLVDHGSGLERCSQRQEGGVLDKDPDGGQKEITNGHKSKKIVTGSKRKSKGASGTESGEHLKDGLHRRIVSGGSLKGSPDVLRSDLDSSGKKAKKIVKDKKHFEAEDDLWKDAEGSSEEHAKIKLSCRKMKVQTGHEKQNLVTKEVSHPVKRSKRADIADDATKGSLQTNQKSSSRIPNVVDGNVDDAEVKRSAARVKAESVPGDEDVLPPTKRRRRALEAMSGSSTSASEDKIGKSSIALKSDLLHSENVKSPVIQSHAKRRAVRLCDDDDDEEPKTPIHGGSTRKVQAPSRASDSIKNSDVCADSSIHDQPSARDSNGLEDVSSKGLLPPAEPHDESLSPNPHQTSEMTPKKAMPAHVSCSPGNLESEKVSSKEPKQVMVSPKRSPWSVTAAKPGAEPHKANKSSGKTSGNVMQRKPQAGPNKGSGLVLDGSNFSHNQTTNERSKLSYSKDRAKATPKSNSLMNDSSFVAGNLVESNSIPGERLEAGRDDRTSSFIDSKIADSDMSMKHLIAAAQAKRRQAHLQNLSYGNPNSALAAPTDVLGGSPSLVLGVQPLLSISGSMMQPDILGYYPRSSLASPSSHGRQFSSNNRPDTEETEERRVSSGHQPAGGSLSGGTEAAVARDAFEGMIETLSRTKESIGRATRLAIDCAKYGIANEVVELLIRKLESEPSFHRRVDLFFLVDSITQCSHSHKGIAGASYIPTVQAALPRLLGAAAPPGSSARENRRQCLKVLRLWLERKILPESLLRRYMDDIGVSNDDTSAGFFLKRPSRAERAVDDPIREMEGMLVDEYGSNATFQLPGFISSHVFEEEEEEEEEKEDLPSSSRKEAGDLSPVETTPATGDLETFSVTPSDRRHCILEDVDGELEMEDVSGHPKDERSSLVNGSFEIASQQQCSDGIFTGASSNPTEFSPLLNGSPPLPLDSPPPTPPLPASPPPPPPPPPSLPPPLPSSPSPPPPPPPPIPFLSQPQPLPPLPAGPPPLFRPQLSLPPQPSMASQQLHPLQSAISSSFPKLAYQPPVPHEYSGAPRGNQLIQMAANARHGAHTDASFRSEFFPQQAPCFMPAGACNSREPSGFNSSRPQEYVQSGIYINPQTSQANKQFQPGSAPFAQRPFHSPPPPPPPPPLPPPPPPPPPPQTPSGHFSYSKPTVQQHPQHPCPPPYPFPNLPDGPRPYFADEQWRMPPNEFNVDHQRGMWMSGGRSFCRGPPFPQEGYFRPTLERPPTNVGFQPSAPNALPPGAPIPGHSVSQMMPCRPDMPAIKCWRPV